MSSVASSRRRHPRAHAHAPAIAEVGEDAQAAAAAGQVGGPVGQRLGHGVRQVGAHRVPAVDVDVQDHAPRQRPHLQRARPAAAVDQPRKGGLRQRQQLRRRLLEARARGVVVADVQHLDLRGHHRVVGVGEEAAPGPHHAGGVRGRRDDRRFFHHHRHQEVPIVDPKVEPQPEGQAIDPDDVLDHPVGGLGVEPAAVEDPDVVFRERLPGDELAPPFGDGQAVETRDARAGGHVQIAVTSARASGASGARGASKMPWATANRTRSAVVRTASLRLMFVRWNSTVFGLMAEPARDLGGGVSVDRVPKDLALAVRQRLQTVAAPGAHRPPTGRCVGQLRGDFRRDVRTAARHRANGDEQVGGRLRLEHVAHRAVRQRLDGRRRCC